MSYTQLQVDKEDEGVAEFCPQQLHAALAWFKVLEQTEMRSSTNRQIPVPNKNLPPTDDKQDVSPWLTGLGFDILSRNNLELESGNEWT